MTCAHPHPKWDGDELFCNDCGEHNFSRPTNRASCATERESRCLCAAGEAGMAELEAEFAWMKPHVAAAMQAERDGDFETARAITESCGVRYAEIPR